MRDQELVNAIRRLKVETGSLACMGCGHEHNCGVSGCASTNRRWTAGTQRRTSDRSTWIGCLRRSSAGRQS